MIKINLNPDIPTTPDVEIGVSAAYGDLNVYATVGEKIFTLFHLSHETGRIHRHALNADSARILEDAGLQLTSLGLMYRIAADSDIQAVTPIP